MSEGSSAISTDAVILCGGLGTRLRPISKDLPKALMPFAGRTFIDILIESLLPFGFRRFVLCVGYHSEKVREHFGRRDYEVVFSEEAEPLGTGGALKNAMPHILSSPFLLLNGDSLCPTDLTAFLGFHDRKGGVLSMVLARPLVEQDYGVIILDGEARITAFREKEAAHKGSYINAGIYLMDHRLFDLMPASAAFSLERDLIPELLPHGCYGYITDGTLIDIGSPERYLRARTALSPKESTRKGSKVISR
jgi:NDP-sugar pyrophosphorylase family protein